LIGMELCIATPSRQLLVRAFGEDFKKTPPSKLRSQAKRQATAGEQQNEKTPNRMAEVFERIKYLR